jgi:hypothetical protein
MCPRSSGSGNRAEVATGRRPFLDHSPDGRTGQHGIFRDNTPAQEIAGSTPMLRQLERTVRLEAGCQFDDEPRPARGRRPGRGVYDGGIQIGPPAILRGNIAHDR